MLTKSLLLKSTLVVVVVVVVVGGGGGVVEAKYEPNWNSLDARPLPSWYDEGKVGIFFHWGVFSVPSFAGEFFWNWWQGHSPHKAVTDFMTQNYRPDWSYADFAKQFTVQEGIFDAAHWADVFNASGARYVVQVTKHHEGFTSWPSTHSFSWNAMDVGPKRDLVAEVSEAVRKYPKLKYGVYHSLFEWFNPLYLKDKANNFSTQDFVKYKTLPELYELVNTYKPELIWSDGANGPVEYWNSTYFLAWLYNDSPVKDTIVVNDRWGTGADCHHGGYLTCTDRYNPKQLVHRKFENAMTLDKLSWGYRREATLNQILTIEELVATLVETVSCNGNILINVGPTKDGVIPLVFEERLRQLGSWLEVNGEAIYKTRPWTFQNDPVTSSVWYTTSTPGDAHKTVYAIALEWPGSNLTLGAPIPSALTNVTLLGYHGNFSYKQTGSKGMNIDVPSISFNTMPCKWAWVFRLTNITN